jgi:SET domain
MYKPYLKVESSKINGKGTFTTVKIPSDVAVMEMTGTVLLDKELPPNADMNMYLQIGPNTYLGPSGEADDFVNHSCDPNCKVYVVGNRAILWSLYVIPAGAELTFDYSTTSTDTPTSWKMNCKCGSYKCRKTISGFSSLDPALQDNYTSRNMVPMYITWPGLIQKR